MFPLCRHLAFSLEPTVDSGHSPCSAHTDELFLQLGFSKRLSSVSPEGGLSLYPQPVSPLSPSSPPSLHLSFQSFFFLNSLVLAFCCATCQARGHRGNIPVLACQSPLIQGEIPRLSSLQPSAKCLLSVEGSCVWYCQTDPYGSQQVFSVHR